MDNPDDPPRSYSTMADRWSDIDAQLRRRQNWHASDLEARDTARKRYLKSLKPLLSFLALPIELQLAIIEWLPYDDLKAFA